MSYPGEILSCRNVIECEVTFERCCLTSSQHPVYLEQVLNSSELRNRKCISCDFLENVINLCNEDNKMISRGEERKTGKTPLSDRELAAGW